MGTLTAVGWIEGRNYLLPSPYPFPGREKYSPVEEQYYQKGNVKAGRGGKYLVAHVLRHDALEVLVDAGFPLGILPAEQGCDRNQHRQGPDDDDHVAYPPGRPLVGVVDVRDGPVPVNEVKRETKISTGEFKYNCLN